MSHVTCQVRCYQGGLPPFSNDANSGHKKVIKSMSKQHLGPVMVQVLPLFKKNKKVI